MMHFEVSKTARDSPGPPRALGNPVPAVAVRNCEEPPFPWTEGDLGISGHGNSQIGTGQGNGERRWSLASRRPGDGSSQLAGCDCLERPEGAIAGRADVSRPVDWSRS